VSADAIKRRLDNSKLRLADTPHFSARLVSVTATTPQHRAKRTERRLSAAMRRLADAKQSWQELQQYPSLAELKEAVRLDGHLSAPNNGLRSACWKAFLLFDNVDTASWPRILLSSRSAYNSLRLHFLRHIENPEEQADPLAEETDVSSTSDVAVAFPLGVV